MNPYYLYHNLYNKVKKYKDFTAEIDRIQVRLSTGETTNLGHELFRCSRSQVERIEQILGYTRI